MTPVLNRKSHLVLIPAKAGAVPAAPSDQWVISPITGERIRADQLQEHMRVALLDPRWREQRDRALEEKKRHEDPYAPGRVML
jgi:splicing factor 3A subunit 1